MGLPVQFIHGLTSCSEWTGVPLSVLLNEAGVKTEATWMIAEGAERGKYDNTMPVAKAMEDVLVAYGQNGEPLRVEQGYPIRLLVPVGKPHQHEVLEAHQGGGPALQHVE